MKPLHLVSIQQQGSQHLAYRPVYVLSLAIRLWMLH